MKKIAILIFCGLILSACKVELAPTINLSDVNSETAKTIQSNLFVEVSACTDYKDSHKESLSLTKAKEKIASVFADANYIECYREQMESKALFEVPITVGGKAGTGDIQISNAEFGGGMVVQMSKSLKDKINRASKSGTGKLNPSINITLINDLNNNQEIIAHAVYLDQKAIPLAKYTLKSGNHTFRLADVSVSSVINNGSALVFEDSDKRMSLDK